MTISGLRIALSSAALALITTDCAGSSVQPPAGLQLPAAAQRSVASSETALLPGILEPAGPTPNGTWAYTGHFTDSTVSVLTMKGVVMSTLGSKDGINAPQGIAAGRVAGYMYVANTGAGNVPFYSIGKSGAPTLVDTFNASVSNPVAVAAYEIAGKSETSTIKQIVVAISSTGGKGGQPSLSILTETFPSRVFTTLATVTIAHTATDSMTTLTDNSKDPNHNWSSLWAVDTSSGVGAIYAIYAPKHIPALIKSAKFKGLAGGVALDGNGNLWYVDQSVGVYKCKGGSKVMSCKVAWTFGNGNLGFDATYKNVMVTDTTKGTIDICPVAEKTCYVWYSDPSDPASGIAIF